MGKINIKSIQRLCLKRVIQANTYFSLRKLLKRKNLRVTYTRQPFNLQTFSEDECKIYFRFSLEEIDCLSEALKIPRVNWLKNRIKFSGKEGLCVLLRRLTYPNKLSDLVPLFKRDIGSISRIFNYMLKWMYNNHAKRLHTLKQKYLTRSELRELADNLIEKGCPYPNVVKYQSVVLTNGLIGRLDVPFVGRRHDASIVCLSSLLDEMKSFFTNNDGTWWAIYGDPGYSNQKYIKVGFKNVRQLNQAEKNFNRLMSSLRVGVEYGFGRIIQQFAYLDFQKTQKQYLSPLKEMYYVAAFLVNCQTFLRGQNQISNIFDSYVPRLEEYLA